MRNCERGHSQDEHQAEFSRSAVSNRIGFNIPQVSAGIGSMRRDAQRCAERQHPYADLQPLGVYMLDENRRDARRTRVDFITRSQLELPRLNEPVQSLRNRHPLRTDIRVPDWQPLSDTLTPSDRQLLVQGYVPFAGEGSAEGPRLVDMTDGGDGQELPEMVEVVAQNSPEEEEEMRSPVRQGVAARLRQTARAVLALDIAREREEELRLDHLATSMPAAVPWAMPLAAVWRPHVDILDDFAAGMLRVLTLVRMTIREVMATATRVTPFSEFLNAQSVLDVAAVMERTSREVVVRNVRNMWDEAWARNSEVLRREVQSGDPLHARSQEGPVDWHEEHGVEERPQPNELFQLMDEDQWERGGYGPLARGGMPQVPGGYVGDDETMQANRDQMADQLQRDVRLGESLPPHLRPPVLLNDRDIHRDEQHSLNNFIFGLWPDLFFDDSFLG